MLTSSSSAAAFPASMPPITCKRIARAKSYIILESRDAIGGTWDLFRYPGIRSDSDMYTFGYSFRPWQSNAAIADGAVDPHLYSRDGARLTASTARSASGHRVKQRVVVVRGRAVDHRGGARTGARAGSLHLQFPLRLHRLLRLCRRLHARISRRREISQAASCIRSNGPRTSIMPASAWW